MGKADVADAEESSQNQACSTVWEQKVRRDGWWDENADYKMFLDEISKPACNLKFLSLLAVFLHYPEPVMSENSPTFIFMLQATLVQMKTLFLALIC